MRWRRLSTFRQKFLRAVFQARRDATKERGEAMTFLARGISLNSDDPLHALLSLTEDAAFRAAVRALDPEEAALAVGRAPTLEDKSRLVWALDPRARADVLDRLHPGFVGALIQNREEENKRLLGDISRVQFTRLLRHCSPERAYYWLTLATSFPDARANLLPLLISIDDLAGALLSEPEFESHCQSVSGCNLEDIGLNLADAPGGEAGGGILEITWPNGEVEEHPFNSENANDLRRYLEEFYDLTGCTVTITGPDGKVRELHLGDNEHVADLRLDLRDFDDIAFAVVTMFGADGMLKEFPIQNARLRRLVQTILDHDPEHYVALVHAAMEIADYRRNHPEEEDAVQRDPIVLNDLLTVEEERARVGLAGEGTIDAPQANGSEPAPRQPGAPPVPNLPVRQSAQLMRAALNTLPAPRQAELSEEMQLLFVQEAAYAGGSFAQADLEQAAGRVQFYVQMGLAGLADGNAEDATRLLAEQRLRTLMESGARQVERMRQVAIRLLPWREVLENRQVCLLESLMHPDPVVNEQDGRPMLRLLRASRKAPVVTLPLETVPAELDAISGWVMLVRGVGKEKIARLMPEQKPAEIARLLVTAVLLYRRWDPELVEPEDMERCRATYLDAATGHFNTAAYQALAEAIHTLAAAKQFIPRAVEEIARHLARAMDELAAGKRD
jgi:hypothetical protein